MPQVVGLDDVHHMAFAYSAFAQEVDGGDKCGTACQLRHVQLQHREKAHLPGTGFDGELDGDGRLVALFQLDQEGVEVIHGGELLLDGVAIGVGGILRGYVASHDFFAEDVAIALNLATLAGVVVAAVEHSGIGFVVADSPNHPLQMAVKNKINSMCAVNKDYPMTTDGCGVPILSMPLKNMVKGFLNLIEYPQIINSIKQNPYLFGGENRTDTEIIQKTDNLIAKVGAGGLCVVLNYKEKSAFALKVNDCSYEARKIALFETINRLGWGKIEYDNKIKTIAGKTVGEIETVFE